MSEQRNSATERGQREERPAEVENELLLHRKLLSILDSSSQNELNARRLQQRTVSLNVEANARPDWRHQQTVGEGVGMVQKSIGNLQRRKHFVSVFVLKETKQGFQQVQLHVQTTRCRLPQLDQHTVTARREERTHCVGSFGGDGLDHAQRLQRHLSIRVLVLVTENALKRLYADIEAATGNEDVGAEVRITELQEERKDVVLEREAIHVQEGYSVDALEDVAAENGETRLNADLSEENQDVDDAVADARRLLVVNENGFHQIQVVNERRGVAFCELPEHTTPTVQTERGDDLQRQLDETRFLLTTQEDLNANAD